MKRNHNFTARRNPRIIRARGTRFQLTPFHQLVGSLSALTFLGVIGLLSPGKVTGLGEAYYPNCDAARAAGVAPLNIGEPGYRAPLDRDGDGVACEPIPW